MLILNDKNIIIIIITHEYIFIEFSYDIFK